MGRWVKSLRSGEANMVSLIWVSIDKVMACCLDGTKPSPEPVVSLVISTSFTLAILVEMCKISVRKLCLKLNLESYNCISRGPKCQVLSWNLAPCASNMIEFLNSCSIPLEFFLLNFITLFHGFKFSSPVVFSTSLLLLFMFIKLLTDQSDKQS